MKPDHLELVLIDRARNARRFYSLSIVPLPPGVVLVVQRGRIGSPLRTERTRFADLAALRKKWRALEALRRSHGYEERDTRQLALPFPALA